jgi:hypothetical protein
MKETRITIEIDHEGRITADADGFSGDACLKELERLLHELSPGKATIDHKPGSGAQQIIRNRKQDLGRKS